MKQKKYIVYILIILLFNSCLNNNEGADTKDVFIKYYTTHKKCKAVDFIISQDNKYILLGTTTEESSGKALEGILLIITNDDGNEVSGTVLYHKKEERSNNSRDSKDVPSKIIETKDKKGYIILSHIQYNEDESSIVIWKLDKNFKEENIIEITTGQSTQQGTPIKDIATDIIETETPNEFIITGYTNNIVAQKEYNNNEDFEDVLEIVLNIKGTNSVNKYDTSQYKVDITWRGEGKEDKAISTIYKKNGRILVFGNTKSYRNVNSNSNIFYYDVIAKNNPSIGRYIFETGANAQMNSVYEIAENNYLIFGNIDTTGKTSKIPFILSTQTGIFTIINTFKGNGYFEIKSTLKTLDENYILAGNYTTPSQSNEKKQMSFFKVDPMGNVHVSFISYTNEATTNKIVATPKFLFGNEGEDEFTKVKETHDQKILLLGTFDYGNENTIIVLIKTNRYGDFIK